FESVYKMPTILQAERERYEYSIIPQLKARYPRLRDGDCVRLSEYSVSEQGPEEDKHLHLTLGRMTWYDYVFANQRFGDPELAKMLPTQFDVRDFIDFERIIEREDVRASSLSNILPVYVTATTVDGYVMYSQRSKYGVGAEGGMLISAVSENLNPAED